MNTHVEKTLENKRHSAANSLFNQQGRTKTTFQFVDNRPVVMAQRKLQEMMNHNRPQAEQASQLQGIADNDSVQQKLPIQKKDNNTGLPDQLKTGIENLSGYSLDEVKVHYNSAKPAQLNAHAYAQGTDIHIASGQEKHLPHEAWHVVQQHQGGVHPTIQLKGTAINDDHRLEQEADVMGQRAAAGMKPAGVAQLAVAKPVVQRMMRRSRRTGPRLASMPYADPRHRTRGSTARQNVQDEEGENLPAPRRNLTNNPFKRAAGGTELWDGSTRPSWNGADDIFFATQASAPGVSPSGKQRMEYSCRVDNAGNQAMLPRKKDAEGNEDIASVGHKTQWRDYIAKHANTEQWDVEGGGSIFAISMEEARSCYCDNDNLELQGQIYNSSVAKAYTSEAPGQAWVED
jgi:hypothetical protein